MIWLRYACVFVVTALGTGVLVSVLKQNVTSGIGSSAQLMVPAMIAAVIEGQRWAKTQKVKPNSGQVWGFAWIAAALATGLNVVLAYGAGAILPEFAKLAIAPALSKQFLILLGIYAGGYLICNWFFYNLGAGNQLTLMQDRDKSK
ncbi:ABZJ_00895 family protein [Roseovarius sp. EL26]|uniref:ABZJ_00895 family protein n=1 Tax=Roseovarius sp. EL26 TaxID=2126672 RepID=UPI000EA3F9CD|nr:ABZJ_00895 family protein [Roseovarius sp. EL26]